MNRLLFAKVEGMVGKASGLFAIYKSVHAMIIGFAV
jgi:hypothetical protein